MMGANIYSVYYTDKLMITMIEQQIIINHPLSLHLKAIIKA